MCLSSVTNRSGLTLEIPRMSSADGSASEPIVPNPSPSRKRRRRHRDEVRPFVPVELPLRSSPSRGFSSPPDGPNDIIDIDDDESGSRTLAKWLSTKGSCRMMRFSN